MWITEVENGNSHDFKIDYRCDLTLFDMGGIILHKKSF